MTYLLDTNVVSELRWAKSGRADPAVVAWATGRSSWELHLSAITVMELELGVLLKARHDERRGRALATWLDGVLREYARRTLPVDSRVARRCAALHVPDPRPERDAFIAATAAVHGLTLVTRNVKDFRDVGVAVIDPWAHERSGPG